MGLELLWSSSMKFFQLRRNFNQVSNHHQHCFTSGVNLLHFSAFSFWSSSTTYCFSYILLHCLLNMILQAKCTSFNIIHFNMNLHNVWELSSVEILVFSHFTSVKFSFTSFAFANHKERFLQLVWWSVVSYGLVERVKST